MTKTPAPKAGDIWRKADPRFKQRHDRHNVGLDIRPARRRRKDSAHDDGAAPRNRSPMSRSQPKPGQIWRDRTPNSTGYVKVLAVGKTEVKILSVVENGFTPGQWIKAPGGLIALARRNHFGARGNFAFHTAGSSDISNRDRLARIATIIEAADQRAMQVDGPVSPTLAVMTQEEISRIYALAKGMPEEWRPE